VSQRPFDTGPDDAALADHLVEGQHLIDLAASFVERYSYDRFMSDELVHYSGSMLIIRLREVANRLPQHFKDSHPDVPWRAIIGMGRFITHERANRADPDAVWATLAIEFLSGVCSQVVCSIDPPCSYWADRGGLRPSDIVRCARGGAERSTGRPHPSDHRR